MTKRKGPKQVFALLRSKTERDGFLREMETEIAPLEFGDLTPTKAFFYAYDRNKVFSYLCWYEPKSAIALIAKVRTGRIIE